MESFQEVILLDTHTLLWVASDPGKLSQNASQAIRKSSGRIAISAITLWEIAWLATNRRLDINGTVEALWRELHRERRSGRSRRKLLCLQISPSSYLGDPCDRLIGATALAEGMALVTKDRNIRNSRQVKTIW